MLSLWERRKWHNFGLKTWTREKLMVVWSQLGIEEHKNLQMNCISQLLTALFISLTLFSTPIYQICVPGVAFFLKCNRFFEYPFPMIFSSEYVALLAFSIATAHEQPLLEVMQEIEVFFMSWVSGGDCFYLKEFWPALQTDLQAENFDYQRFAKTNLLFDKNFLPNKIKSMTFDELAL